MTRRLLFGSLLWLMTGPKYADEILAIGTHVALPTQVGILVFTPSRARGRQYQWMRTWMGNGTLILLSIRTSKY